VAERVEPAAQQVGIADRVEATTVFGQEGPFGDDVQAGKQGQAFIEDITHDMAVACVAEEFEGQQGAQGVRRGDHGRAGEAGLTDQAVKRQLGEHRQEQEQTAEPGVQGAGLEVELLDVGDVGERGSSAGRAFVIGAAWQFGEAFLVEDLRDGGRRQRLAGLVQGTADIVNREILLAQGDDVGPVQVFLGRSVGAFGGGEEEGAVGLLAELVDQGAEAGRGIAEACGDLGSGQLLDAVGA